MHPDRGGHACHPYAAPSGRTRWAGTLLRSGWPEAHGSAADYTAGFATGGRRAAGRSTASGLRQAVNSPHDATGCNLAQRQPAARRRPGACPLAWRITPHQSPAVYLSASNGPRKTPNLAKRLRELRFASQTSLASARLETEASQSCRVRITGSRPARCRAGTSSRALWRPPD